MIDLLQISDLHIGEKPQGVGASGPGAASGQPTRMPSERGHNYGVADSLSQWWEKLAKAIPSAMVVVTGDLTRLGEGLEFGCAHSFCHRSWLMDPQARYKVGLNAGSLALTVPGNHDFWDGLHWPFHIYLYRDVLGSHFWPLPWLEPVTDPARNGLEIHVAGIDSCSGLWNISPRQVIGRGAIDRNHLHDAQNLLQNELLNARIRGASLVVRVALLHHPPELLTTQSQSELDNWLRSNDVHVVLCGHVHTHSRPQHPRLPYILRCGTTLQSGTWNTLPGLEPNHFYHHTVTRLDPQQLRVRWETRAWWHTGMDWTPDVRGQPLWWETFPGLPL